jgi:hypothetical protein
VLSNIKTTLEGSLHEFSCALHVSSNTQYAAKGQWSISYSLKALLESENDAYCDLERVALFMNADAKEKLNLAVSRKF